MTDLTGRVGALEETLRRLEPLIVRIDEQLRVTLPTLATKAELQAFRTELKTEVKDTRVALETEIQGVRTELKTEVKDTRVALETEIQGVRADLETRINDVRTNLTAEVQDLRTEWRATLPALASKADVQELKSDLGARLAEKPGRGFIVTTVFAAIGLCVAAVAATVATLQYM